MQVGSRPVQNYVISRTWTHCHNYCTCAIIVIIFYSLQHWSTLNKSGAGPWPEGRSHHAACCLNYGDEYPQLLVTGGLDRQGKPLADIWTLGIKRGSWKKVGHNKLLHDIVLLYNCGITFFDHREQAVYTHLPITILFDLGYSSFAILILLVIG